MADILEKICGDKKREIARRKMAVSLPELQKKAERMHNEPRGFADNLRKKREKGEIGLIAEIKKASPSRGLIRENFEPAPLAKAYYEGGASCISVLTDQPYFQGDDEYIALVKDVVPLPVLRKDFILEPYQIFESRMIGADCILLILAALQKSAALELEHIALDLGMDVLIETHDEFEMDQAISMSAPLIGVNNRNLKTLEIDLSLCEDLLPKVPKDRIAVAESGFYTYDNFLRLQPLDITTFLVGESLMRKENVKEATRKLLGYAS